MPTLAFNTFPTLGSVASHSEPMFSLHLVRAIVALAVLNPGLKVKAVLHTCINTLKYSPLLIIFLRIAS